MIKAILIDNAGVLINSNDGLFYNKITKHSPYSSKYIEINFEKGKHHRMEMGKLTTYEFYKDVCKRLKLTKYSYKQFEYDWPKRFYRNKSMERFVKANHKKYKIWMLTNTNTLHYNYLKKKFKIYNYLKKKVVSYKVGMAKPDLNIYRYTLKKIKLKPEECLFIDNKGWNITPARKLGIKCIWYRNFRQFKRELKRFL